MKIAVRYYTRGGNTAKLAEAIAKALRVPCESVDTPLAERADILFLGSSYYAFDVDPAIKAFIAQNRDMIGRIVNFGTSACMGSTVKKVREAAAGIPVDVRAFHCYGSFGPFHRNRPNESDMKNAAGFALDIIKQQN